jgi:hypothetical protein
MLVFRFTFRVVFRFTFRLVDVRLVLRLVEVRLVLRLVEVRLVLRLVWLTLRPPPPPIRIPPWPPPPPKLRPPPPPPRAPPPPPPRPPPPPPPREEKSVGAVAARSVAGSFDAPRTGVAPAPAVVAARIGNEAANTPAASNARVILDISPPFSAGPFRRFRSRAPAFNAAKCRIKS